MPALRLQYLAVLTAQDTTGQLVEIGPVNGISHGADGQSLRKQQADDDVDQVAALGAQFGLRCCQSLRIGRIDGSVVCQCLGQFSGFLCNHGFPHGELVRAEYRVNRLDFAGRGHEGAAVGDKAVFVHARRLAKTSK